jgi:anti-anti-sigma factor
MKLVVQDREGDVVRIACAGSMTLIPPTGQADLLRDVAGPDCFRQTVRLSLADTDYVDSSGISWLVVLHGEFLKAGGRLIVHSIPPRVREMFDLLRLSTLLHLAGDEEAQPLSAGGKG